MKRLGLAIALCGLSVQARPQTIEDAAQENLPRVGDANPGYNYDIFGTGHDCDETGNCHNKTDEFLAAAWARHMKAGALVCQEDPRTDPRYHTAVWLVLAHGKACILNSRGKLCCWHDGGLPPDISKGKGQECAAWACVSQYQPQTFWGRQFESAESARRSGLHELRPRAQASLPGLLQAASLDVGSKLEGILQRL